MDLASVRLLALNWPLAFRIIDQRRSSDTAELGTRRIGASANAAPCESHEAGTRERPVPADFPHDATSTISIARKKTAITLDGGFLNVR
jgi:hypothetical protein